MRESIKDRLCKVGRVAIATILALSVLVQVPTKVKASHNHGDACYGNGCSKHSHVSGCESISKTQTSGSTKRACTSCTGV